MRRTALLVAALAALGALPAGAAGDGPALQRTAARLPAALGCGETATGRARARRVSAALTARMDIWGDELLGLTDGPTFDAAWRYLPPLFLARGPGGRPLTASGVHYLPFGRPAGPQGSGSVPLHVADGSQVVSQRQRGATLTVAVGPGGDERYGSCRGRLSPPVLAGGFLPILRTAYVDVSGTRYRQESFAAPLPGSGALSSFVRVTADTHASQDGAVIRLLSSGDRSLAFAVPPDGGRTVHVAWPNRKVAHRLQVVDRETYEAARRSARDYWLGRLADGALVVVPERRVMDAMRNLLIQNLVLTWRYSVGNPYQELATADGIAAAGVIGAYGFGEVEREILRTSFRKAPGPFPNWKMGAKLAGTGLHHRRFPDRRFVDEVTPVLAGYVRMLGRQLDASTTGLLPRERFSQDVAEPVIGLHAQAVVWQGLRLMGEAWSATGHHRLAATCGRLAARLGGALRHAARASERRLADGSLFVPVRLLDDERPYDALSASRAGTYWNLVMPYALASGLFPPGGRRAEGVLRYLLRHGSRLLGLVRAGAYALYGSAPYPAGGTDQVYGLGMARFLADNDEPDQLALSLYGQLAAGMTPGTFVAGEAASVLPLHGERYRTMFLPPNGTANAAFLETLRLMLLHETTDSRGRPRGLELAYATPRAWLAPGKRIEVSGLPTSFGRLSFALHARDDAIRGWIDVPPDVPIRTLRLRLRLPDGATVSRVIVGARRTSTLPDGTIELPPRAGRLVISARIHR